MEVKGIALAKPYAMACFMSEGLACSSKLLDEDMTVVEQLSKFWARMVD